MLICSLLQSFVLLPSSSVAIICNSRRPFHFGQASVNQMTRNTILVQLNFIQKIYGTKTFSLIKKMSNSCEKTHIYDICFILKKTQTQSQSFGITSKICHKRVWTGPFMWKIYGTSLYWLACIEYTIQLSLKRWVGRDRIWTCFPTAGLEPAIPNRSWYVAITSRGALPVSYAAVSSFLWS